MKHPTFFEGVAVAFAASVFGSALYTALTLVFSGAGGLRVLIAGLGLVYVLYLLGRSRVRVGRITTLAGWTVVAAATWVMEPPLAVYVLVHLSAIWLIRSLYFYSSALSALADLGLTGLSLAAAIWAATQSGSVFLSIWCFFLVQALFVAIPTRISRKAGERRPGQYREDRFQRAYRTAEAALRKLSSVR